MSEVLLLADNDPEFCQVWGKILSEAGYELIFAATPQEAQNILRNRGVDLAILDLRLEDDNDAKDISGLEIARDAALRNMPKIILTGYSTYTSHVLIEPMIEWIFITGNYYKHIG